MDTGLQTTRGAATQTCSRSGAASFTMQALRRQSASTAMRGTKTVFGIWSGGLSLERSRGVHRGGRQAPHYVQAGFSDLPRPIVERVRHTVRASSVENRSVGPCDGTTNRQSPPSSEIAAVSGHTDAQSDAGKPSAPPRHGKSSAGWLHCWAMLAKHERWMWAVWPTSGGIEPVAPFAMGCGPPSRRDPKDRSA